LLNVSFYEGVPDMKKKTRWAAFFQLPKGMSGKIAAIQLSSILAAIHEIPSAIRVVPKKVRGKSNTWKLDNDFYFQVHEQEVSVFCYSFYSEILWELVHRFLRYNRK